jgi:hypothetical protein
MTMTAPSAVQTLDNPHNPLPEDVQAHLRAREATHAADFASRAEAEQATRPTTEERAERVEAYTSTQRANGVDVDGLRATLSDLRSRRSDRVHHDLARRTAADVEEPDLTPVLFDAPAPVDHSFWSATFSTGGDGEFQRTFFADGLHFTGGITHHSGNLRHAEFWASGTYVVSAARIPPSPSGRWRSSPHIELFGAVRGYTGDSDIFSGDLWSKCWMHRKQTLLQSGFGLVRTIAQREETQTLIFEENQDRTVTFTAPGFIPMPNLDFGGINTALDLVAIVETHFEIQIEGAGSVLDLNPNLIYRGFQWPMQPL